MTTIEEQQRRLGTDVANYFTRNPRLEFAGFAGLGRHGGALILEQKGESATDRGRKLVIKYSLGDLSTDPDSNADEDLRNEFRWLQMLRGAEHVVQLVDLADCTLRLPGISDGEDTFQDSVRRRSIEQQNQTALGATTADGETITQDFPNIRRCPTFALEYLPGGTLFRFYRRVVTSELYYVPSRLLWRIWLCMVRQVVAMAFPPNTPENLYHGQEQREEVVPGRQYYMMTQNSPHLENFLFGEVKPSPDTDHDPGVPTLKLIDFGRGKNEDVKYWEKEGLPDPYECASRKNLMSAALAITKICCPNDDQDDLGLVGPYNAVEYSYMKNGTQQTVWSEAPRPLRTHERIDQQLRDLLVRCMAIDFNDIPSLQSVSDETKEAVASKGPDGNPRETDEYILRYVQAFIHEPNV